jgi:hypothetical protein
MSLKRREGLMSAIRAILSVESAIRRNLQRRLILFEDAGGERDGRH